jgi:hypothetical protein
MTEKPKGDPWIIEQLEIARSRNRNGDNPNLSKGRMIFDFRIGKIRVEQAA